MADAMNLRRKALEGLRQWRRDGARYPLELSADASYFKLFMVDVGLLACACGMDVVRDLRPCPRAAPHGAPLYPCEHPVRAHRSAYNTDGFRFP